MFIAGFSILVFHIYLRIPQEGADGLLDMKKDPGITLREAPSSQPKRQECDHAPGRAQ